MNASTGSSSWNVGVVGCGTAGAATALFLARAGHRVTVYERVEEPGPVGAGIMLQPIGQAVLARLGLLEPILARGARIDGLRCETPSHRTILDLQYQRVRPEWFGIGLHRGVLFEQLYGAVLRQHIPVILDCEIERLDMLEDGQVFAVDQVGRRHGPHDLVVVADGARSKLREGLDMPRRVSTYPWGALWFVGFDPEQRFKHRLFQVADGTGRLVGLLPTGLGPRRSPDIPLTSLFWSLRIDGVDAWLDAGLEAWKRDILRYVPSAAALLDQVVSPEQVTFAEYYDARMYPWYTPGAVYLGDAAHAMSPQLGQGANLALMDALVLAECLSAPLELPQALQVYAQRRRAHLRFYQWATRLLTPFFQSGLEPLGWLRDLFLGPLSKIPPLARQMVASMAGVKLGAFRALPPGGLEALPAALLPRPEPSTGEEAPASSLETSLPERSSEADDASPGASG